MGALGKLRVAEAVPALCNLIAAESSFGEGAQLKEAAASALGHIGAGSAVPTLCEMLEGGAMLSAIAGVRARVAAARALGELGGPDARAALEQGSRSVNRSLRKASRRALQRLQTMRAMSRGRSLHAR